MGDSTIYKVLKQGYPATHCFKDEAVGTSGTDIGYVSATTFDDTCAIVASKGGHKKVLHLKTAGGAIVNGVAYSSPQISGTIELCLYNAIADDFYFRMRSNDGNHPVDVRCLSKTTLRIYSGDGMGGNNTTDVTIVEDEFFHLKFTFDCTTDKFSCWVNGILKIDDQNFALDITCDNLVYDNIYTGDAAEFYIDAIGYSWDANYNVGDNIHWRNYKDQDSDFESEDCGTAGTSIGFVDTDNSGGGGTVTIIPEFNEHKKVLELYHGPLAADDAGCENDFVLAQVFGTIELWIEITDATYIFDLILESGGVQKIHFRIVNDIFQWNDDGAWQTLSATPLDNTKHHIRIDFECGAGAYKGLAEDTATIYINNVNQGTYGFAAVADNLDKLEFLAGFTATYSVYIDAVSYSWTSGNKIADNRLLEYHSLSKTDITSKCSKCTITKAVTIYSTASIETTETLGDEHYLQIIDENSDLRFIGNRFKDIDIGISVNGYSFQDLNKVELEKEDSYTATAAEDVNASLLGILTNVGQADGRLIYYTEDDPAGNLKPNYRNKPRHMITRILAIRGGKKCIIKASGKIFIDDDANPDNGAATITGTSSALMGIPLINRSSHQINYVEVRGGIDPDTGTPFSGISQDASAQADGTGIIPYYKRLRELQSDLDCQNVAIAIRTGTNFTPQIIRVRLRGIYADPGEVINFANSNKSFTATNCYVDGVRMNVLNNVCNYSLNTGISDPITFNSPGYTYADETADDIAETLRNTDINTVDLNILATSGAPTTSGLQITNTEYFIVSFHIDDYVDDSREILITITYHIAAGAGGTFDFLEYFWFSKTDGSEDYNNAEESNTPTFPATTLGKVYKYQYTMAASKFDAGDSVLAKWIMNEADKEIRIRNITLRYYIKRTI